MRPLLLLLFCCACGAGVPFEPHGTCTTSEGVGHLFVEDDRDCYCLGAQVDRARAELAQAGFLPADENLDGVDVYVRAARGTFQAGDGDYMYGRYVPTSDRAGFVELDRYAGSLAHELLHHHDMKTLGASRATTAAHTEWKERGWLELGERVRGATESAACK